MKCEKLPVEIDHRTRNVRTLFWFDGEHTSHKGALCTSGVEATDTQARNPLACRIHEGKIREDRCGRCLPSATCDVILVSFP